MRRLKDKYCGERAAVIFGGPSLIEQRFDLGGLKQRGYTIFLETKALTPYLLRLGVEPDYLLMLFPEKSKDNALQNFIFRSFLAQMNIKPFLRRSHAEVLRDLRENFDGYFESWRPEKGAHKRYRWKADVYLKDSPFDLLQRLPKIKVIANRKLLEQFFPTFGPRHECYFFDQAEERQEFDVHSYYAPIENNGTILVRYNTFFNSAAIALYPLLHYMGFREVFLLGMDMSMLGSMEYAALYTFKSMLHFRWYFHKTNHAFSAAYRPNRPFYLRPKSEFEDVRRVLDCEKTQFIRVYDPFKYAAPIVGIRTISMKQFVQQ